MSTEGSESAVAKKLSKITGCERGATGQANQFTEAPDGAGECAEDETRRASLEKAGLAFNDIDIETFRDTLRRQGYYARLKARYDAQTWTAIEAVSGRLG